MRSRIANAKRESRASESRSNPAVRNPAMGVTNSALNGGSQEANGQAGLPNGDEQDARKSLIDMLTQSKLYREYERSFREAIGVPLTLRAEESWQLPYHGKRGENAFCAVMASKSRACAACLRTAQRLSRLAARHAATVSCAAGLSETAIPVRVGDRLLGFLQTGQVFTRPPTQSQFERTARLLSQWDVPIGKKSLRDAFFSTRTLSTQQQQSIVTLLTIFGQHLSMIGEQMTVWQANSEPPVIAKAKSYIGEHQADDLSLGQVAKAVNASTFYFCKLFKRSTGTNFVDYVSRLRIAKAKNLLLNPHCMVSEIAFEVGFQSLTHFNRVFKKRTGQSPSEYRAQIPSE
jgi:AraC-like DNA-binding protein/ligand-binding sensor protein